MIIALKKKKENIVAYVLYMWQVEDLIRANRFDAGAIRQNIANRYRETEEVKNNICRWYEEISEMMRSEGVMQEGHIRLVTNVIVELTTLHLRLLASQGETLYRTAYYKILPSIVELRAKSGGRKALPELETCFTAIYGYLTLKMQQKAVSAETEKAVRELASFLAILAGKYREEIYGEPNIDDLYI
jgi:hypothetical protein